MPGATHHRDARATTAADAMALGSSLVDALAAVRLADVALRAVFDDAAVCEGVDVKALYLVVLGHREGQAAQAYFSALCEVALGRGASVSVGQEFAVRSAAIEMLGAMARAVACRAALGIELERSTLAACRIAETALASALHHVGGVRPPVTN